MVAVRLQAVRILGGYGFELKQPLVDAGHVLSRQADGHLLAISLLQVRALADLVGRQVTGGPRAEIEQALQEFDAALPDLKNSRNIAAHMDAYIEGKGRLQRNVSDPEFQISVRTELENGVPTEYVLSITVAPGLAPIRLPVSSAAAAAQELCNATCAVAWA